MASLTSCPLEIILMIIEAGKLSDKRTLNSLALTCRRIHCFVNPVLWAEAKKQGWPVVQLAAKRGLIETLKVANKLDFDIFHLNGSISTMPAAIAVHLRQNQALTWLLDHGVDVDQMCDALGKRVSLLHLAFRAGNSTGAIILLSRGAKLSPSYSFNTNKDVHPMIAAIGYGLDDVVKYMVTQCGVSVHDPVLTPIHTAVSLSQPSVVACLLDLGARIDLEAQAEPLCFCYMAQENLFSFSYYASLLHIALCQSTWRGKEQLEALAIDLISRGAPLEYHDPRSGSKKWKWHAVLDAIRFSQFNVVKHLVTTCGINLTEMSIGHLAPSFINLTTHCSPAVLKQLLHPSLGLNPNGPGATWEESYVRRELTEHHSCTDSNSIFQTIYWESWQDTYRRSRLRHWIQAGASITSSDVPKSATSASWKPSPIHDLLVNHNNCRNISWDGRCGSPRDLCINRSKMLDTLIEYGADVNLHLDNCSLATPLDAAIACRIFISGVLMVPFTLAPLDYSLRDVVALVKAGAKVEKKHLAMIRTRLWLKGTAIYRTSHFGTSHFIAWDVSTFDRYCTDLSSWVEVAQEMQALLTHLAKSADEMPWLSKEVLAWAVVDGTFSEIVADRRPYYRRLLQHDGIWSAIITLAMDSAITVEHLENGLDQGYCEKSHSSCKILIDQAALNLVIDLPGQQAWKWMEREEESVDGAEEGSKVADT